ncbi:MAG: hypothetical protein GDA53_04915 [Rhodobacteraceae bacterium]|nr:hypothetical protein [Paracoccaceae bacterium]
MPDVTDDPVPLFPAPGGTRRFARGNTPFAPVIPGVEDGTLTAPMQHLTRRLP